MSTHPAYGYRSNDRETTASRRPNVVLWLNDPINWLWTCVVGGPMVNMIGILKGWW